MKKYRNFIITMILSCLVGGLIGAFGHKGVSLNLNFGDNPRLFAFKIFLMLGIIMLISIFGLIINLKAKFKKTDLENIPNKIDKEINNLLYINSVFVIICFTWMGVMISKSFGDIKESYLSIAVLAVVVSSVLQIISVMIYNKYYPNKKLNMYENNADKNLFDKLDEGEKWIVYSCSYSTFQNMQLVYSIAMVLTIFLSIFTSISILLPIVIGLLWIIQVSIYSIKANKYNNGDV